MTRTYLILDGLQDLGYARAISRQWSAAGFDNAVDPAGQVGWIARQAGAGDPPLSEADVDRAASITRRYGVEVRDRVGTTFRPDNDQTALNGHMVYEYQSRFATAVVFGLPAIVLHYAAPMLAGGGHDARSMAYPWFFELLLVGWACLAAGWPILWQGVLALVHLRVTGDLLTTAIVLAAYVPSALGTLALPVASRPWFAVTAPGAHSGVYSGGSSGPVFYVAMLAMIVALLQRWLAYRSIERLSGRAMLMMPSYATVVRTWMLLSVVTAFAAGPRWGLALAMLLPPMIGLGAINRWSPNLSMLLPVVAFTIFLWLGPRSLGLTAMAGPGGIGGVCIEIAAGFGLLMAGVMALGWRRGTVPDQ